MILWANMCDFHGRAWQWLVAYLSERSALLSTHLAHTSTGIIILVSALSDYPVSVSGGVLHAEFLHRSHMDVAWHVLSVISQASWHFWIPSGLLHLLPSSNPWALLQSISMQSSHGLDPHTCGGVDFIPCMDMFDGWDLFWPHVGDDVELGTHVLAFLGDLAHREFPSELRCKHITILRCFTQLVCISHSAWRRLPLAII